MFLDHSPTQSPTEGYLVVFEAAEALQGRWFIHTLVYPHSRSHTLSHTHTHTFTHACTHTFHLSPINTSSHTFVLLPILKCTFLSTPLSGSCVAPEVMGSQEFIDAFETAVSSCLNVYKGDVSIQGVKMNDIDPPAVIVDYVVVAPYSSLDSTTMISRLNDECIPSGKITAVLNQNGIPDCTAATKAIIVDRTPTESPTSSPTMKTYMLRSYHQIYGIDLENATTVEFTDYFIDYVQSIASEGPGDSNVTLIRVYDPRITPPDYAILPNIYGTAKSNDSNIVVEYSATSSTQNDTQIAHNLNSAIAAGKQFTSSSSY